MAERKETLEKYGVIFVLYCDGQIQLEERIEKDKRLFGFTIVPGGGIENGESEVTALKREVREEYGVEINVFKKLGVVTYQHTENVINHGNVYFVTDWVGKLDNPEGRNKHLQATLLEARSLCKIPATQEILDLVEKELPT
jgi:8-oxo-dGTP pyrophosphatase MutT (NUDIX family)